MQHKMSLTGAMQHASNLGTMPSLNHYNLQLALLEKVDDFKGAIQYASNIGHLTITLPKHVMVRCTLYRFVTATPPTSHDCLLQTKRRT
jgi:hypothetical protein